MSGSLNDWLQFVLKMCGLMLNIPQTRAHALARVPQVIANIGLPFTVTNPVQI
jgi:hypothetical protein